MRLSTKAVAFTCAIMWGGLLLLVSLGDMMWPEYGDDILDIAADIYPFYDGPGGIGPMLLVTFYGLVDGLIGGFIFGWLYNHFAGRKEA
jgi:hypothetical protein